MIIGIAGGSASGKTTITQELYKYYGDNACILTLDDYYRDLSPIPMDERENVNFDHPDAFEKELLFTHLQALKRGESIEKPLYDFTTHSRKKETEVITPKDYIFVEGLFVLAMEEVRCLCDYTIYVDASNDIRFIRRMHRDINERGRDITSITNQYLNTVRPMHEQFIEPSKGKADLIINTDHSDIQILIDEIIRILNKK